MAATAASSMAHQLPPMSIPAMPRIRPPRMLKGEPHPNNTPAPLIAPERQTGKWVQGKWRTGSSNAVKNKRAIQDIQVKKALRHQTHGLDIYAYRHIRTNQVVYSLTRTLQENKVLKQLLYHGKKTVPATVRNDMWTPYFSIHFPPTPAGALEGLFAFQKLRELSIQRQLSPPENLIRATQEDIDIVKFKIGSPTTLQEMAVRDELQGKIPKLNEILPKKLRARKLMDQKATSVADTAFVLDWILSGPSPWERLTAVETTRLIDAGEMTNRARRRINKMREKVESKATEIRRRAALALQDLAEEDRGSLRVTMTTIQQLSMEHHGIMSREWRNLVGLDGQRYNELRDLKDYDSNKLQEELKGQGLETFKERQQTAKAAERDALKEWFEHNDTPSTEMASVWEQVSLARENALDTFDTQQRTKNLTSPSEAEAGPGDPAQEETTPPSPVSNTNTILSQIETLKPDWANEPREVKMYWADVNDGLFASSWPRSVIHGSLAPFGGAKAWTRILNRDAEGRVVKDKPRIKAPAVVSKSVHIIGSGIDDGWFPEELANGSQQPPVWEEPPPPPQEGEEYQVEYKSLQDESGTMTEGGVEGDAARDAAVQNYGDIVVEQKPKGVWGRVRGMFGR